MEMNIFKSRQGRGKLFAVITVAAILLALLLNLFLTYFGLHKTLYIDMTPEGLYRMTDAMEKECSYVDTELDEKVKIIFCTDPDILVASTNTRVPYFLATELDNTFDNIELETVNVTYNPTAVARYKATSLSEINPSDIIVAYGDRYRVLNADSLWTAADDKVWSFNGEYRLASIIKSVTAKDRPKAYFLPGHGETVYDPHTPDNPGNLEMLEMYNLLTERGLEVKTLDLSDKNAVPDDCVLLVINNPREDLTEDSADKNSYGYVSETEKIDKYLVRDHGSVMVSIDYALDLPVFEAFLGEWGFEISDSRVSESSLALRGDDSTVFSGVYDTDKDGYAYSIYGSFASLSSAPEMVFGNTGYLTSSFGTGVSIPEPGTYSVSRNFAPFFFSSKKALSHAFDEATGDYTDLQKNSEELILAGVTTRLEADSYSAEYSYSYLMCAASPDFFSDDYVGNPAYANYEVLSALVENMIRTDKHASIELGGLSMNSPNVGGKVLEDTTIYSVDTYIDSEYRLLSTTASVWYTVIFLAVPLAVAVVGIVVKIKRRFL